MTDFKRIEHAKNFIDKMAHGINPLDDTPIPDGDIVHNIHVSRCLLYVSEILKKEMGREKIKTSKNQDLPPFSVTAEQLQWFEYSHLPISVSVMGAKINALVKDEVAEGRMQKFSYRKINYWLRDIGMIEWREWGKVKKKRFPTEAGEEMGLVLKIWENYGRRSPVIYLSEQAQHFIIDNIEAVIAAEKGGIFPLQDEDCTDE